MQSADELLYKLRGGLNYIDQARSKIGYTHPLLSDIDAAALIRARDREIIEACKEIVGKWWDRNFGMVVGWPNTSPDTSIQEDIDSVLRDLG